MFSFIVGFAGPNDHNGYVSVLQSRFLEYSETELEVHYRDMNPDAVRRLIEFPAVIMQEGDDAPAGVFRIENIREKIEITYYRSHLGRESMYWMVE